jgi:hypothetical protein
MPNKNYQRGFSAEKRCQEELEAVGYWTQRAYGSKGSWDVIAVCLECTCLIEVKRQKRKIVKQSSIEHQFSEVIRKFREIPDAPRLNKELWIWFDKQSVAGEDDYRPAHWQRYLVTATKVIPSARDLV